MELVTTFNNTLNDFIGNLQKCFPNDTAELKPIESLTNTKPLQKFLKCIEKDLEKISQKDELLFNDAFICIDNFDLSSVWSKTSNTKNKEAIWKFLQTLSLIGTTIKSKSTNLEDFFDQIKNDDDFLNTENVNIQQQMMEILEKLMNTSEDTEDIPENQEEDINDENQTKNPEEEYKEMFQNTKIGNLAKEIAEDIDMSAFDMTEMESPNISSIMEKLTKGNGLKNLIKDVAEKLKSKMEAGDVNQEDLVGEVHEMMDKMKKDKRFKKMFKSKNVQGIFKEMMKQKGGSEFADMDDEDFGVLENMCNSKDLSNIAQKMPQSAVTKRGGQRKNDVRRRLKKKLEEKQNLEI